MSYYSKACSQCGTKLQDVAVNWQSPALCKDCRGKLLGDMRDARPAKRVFPANWTFDDKIDKARELGISYGYFISNAENGMYDFETMGKAKKPEMPKRKRRRSRAG